MTSARLPEPGHHMADGPAHPVPDRRRARGAMARVALAGASSLLLGALAATAVAAAFARRVVTPQGAMREDVEILAVGDGTVTLAATPDTLAPGRYGLWLDRGVGHARLGGVVSTDLRRATVVREVIGVDRGRLRQGPARWNQYFYAGDPLSALGLAFEEIGIEGDGGNLPGWVVPPARGAGGRWAILLHGRGATREECLRALPVLHRLGLTSLVAAYRTTAGLPGVAPGRYHLGDREWLDVEAAILYATSRGAAEVVLLGWSMGGAIALQTLTRSWTADRVRGVVLNGPVLDWRDVLDHQARVNRIPLSVGRLGQGMLSHRTAWRLAGTQAPVDLDRLDWVSRAAELDRPILIIHSLDDEYVPAGPSRSLADARPDLVTFVPVRTARHTKEWNLDPDAWDAAVARFLLRS